MHPDERPSLFDSTTGSSPGSRAGQSPDGDDHDTRPIADLPLFAPAEIATEPERADDRDGRADPAGSEQHATQPVASRAAEGSDRESAGPASVRHRLLASALDAVAMLLTLGLLVAFSLAMGVDVEWADLPLYLPTWLAFGFFYQVLPLLFWGRTPGMTLVGIESSDRRGGPLTFQQATLRWLAGLVTWSLAGIPGTLAFTGRSLVDRASRSRTLASR